MNRSTGGVRYIICYKNIIYNVDVDAQIEASYPCSTTIGDLRSDQSNNTMILIHGFAHTGVV